MKPQKFNGRALTLAVASILAVGVCAVSVNSYAAGTATANLAVSASIASSCVIDLTTAVAFGAYDPIVANKAADLDNTAGRVSTICSNGFTATVTLGQGSHASTSPASTAAAPLRRMSNGTDFLSYTLWSDSLGGTVWGNTPGTGKTTVGTGLPVALTVYARVPQNQNVPAGAYTDIVLATVTF